MPGIWPGRTLRLQLALVYATLFAGSAILLLTIPFLGFKSTAEHIFDAGITAVGKPFVV